MRRRTLLGGLLLSGCATDGAPAELDAVVEAELRRRPADYANGEARAWLVRRDGRERGLLWGTIHVPYSGETVLPRPIRARFAESASVSVESLWSRANAGPYQRAQAAAVRQADPAALAALDPGTRAAVRAAGISAEDEAKLSLMGLGQLVSARRPRTSGGSLPLPGIVDNNLVGFARSVRIPVQALEVLQASPDPVTQDPNGPAAVARLRRVLRPDGAWTGFWPAVLRYYGRGEVARVIAAFVAWQATPEDLQHREAYRAAVLGARNRAWMTPLERTFETPGQHFVAFGCGHLVGEEGVVALLRGRGWDVTACVGDRCG